MSRRFEFVGGLSAKFWEISIVDADVTVRFGRIGGAGQRQHQSFPSASAAHGHAEKLITAKLRKAYHEVSLV